MATVGILTGLAIILAIIVVFFFTRKKKKNTTLTDFGKGGDGIGGNTPSERLKVKKWT